MARCTLFKFDVPEDLLEPQKEVELFFAQRVAELTYAYTRESYRVSTTTVPFLALECLSQIADHQKFDLHISGVERILEELRRRCKDNFIVRSIASMPLEFYFSKDLKNVSDIEDRIRVFSREASPIRYLFEACKALQQAGASEKKKVDFLASEIVCCLVNLGVSQEYIYDMAIKAFFKDEKKEQTRTSAFLNTVLEFSEDTPEFHAIVPVRPDISNISKEILELFRSEIIENIPEGFSATEEFKNEIQGNRLLHIREVRGPDHHSAATYIRRNVVRLHDLLGLFYHKGPSTISQCILIARKNQPETSIVVRNDRNLMELIKDNRRPFAARKLEKMVKTVRLPQGEDREKFFRVVDFHGMSLGSQIPDNQLINLWTSLETIAPSKKGSSIIGSVCARTTPIIGLQYTQRTFNTLAKDIIRWDNKTFKTALKKVSKGNGTVEKVFHLVCDPDYDAICTELLSEMQDFPLLKYRIFTLNGRFATGKKAAYEVRLHMEKAEQQIHRVYRARNSIVHSAEKDKLTENLIISAHEYFDQVFSATTAICSKPFPFDNYRDAFNYIDLAYNSYIERLDEIGDASPTEARDFIWPIAS